MKITNLPILSIILVLVSIIYSIRFARDYKNGQRHKWYSSDTRIERLNSVFYSMLGISRFTPDAASVAIEEKHYSILVLTKSFALVMMLVSLSVIEVYMGRIVWLVFMFMIFIFHMTTYPFYICYNLSIDRRILLLLLCLYRLDCPVSRHPVLLETWRISHRPLCHCHVPVDRRHLRKGRRVALSSLYVAHTKLKKIRLIYFLFILDQNNM